MIGKADMRFVVRVVLMALPPARAELCRLLTFWTQISPRGYKFFSMLNSAEHDVYHARKC